jgi:cellulose synthase/poly-beta-1,6-N-acetylglucosamine synthase-like glycosyltransferase
VASPNGPVYPQKNDETGSRTAKPTVSIIVPHYNDLENLHECLKYLEAQTMARSQYEIIVSDNNSACGLLAVRAACEGIARVVSAPKQGAGEARNAGAAVALSELLAFTDSDCRPARDWLKRGVEALQDADVVGGRMVVGVEDRSRLTAAEAYELVFAFNNRRYVEKQGYSVTANMFTRRDVFGKVGPFRVGVSEDLDWGRRASALGFRTKYAADAIVTHPARRQWPDLIRKWRRLTSESYALTREQSYGRLRWFFRSWLILLSTFVHFPAALRCNELNSFNQRALATYGLIRLRTWRFVECNRRLLNTKGR